MTPTALYTSGGYVPALLNAAGFLVFIDWTLTYPAQDNAINAARNHMGIAS